MDLSNDLISQFVKITNDNVKKVKSETTMYGTVVESDGSKYVKIDGSDILTPIETTAEIVDGERVTVLMKNHGATVTGNITAPSASANKVTIMEEQIADVEDSVNGITGNYASKESVEQLSKNLRENYTNTIDMHDAIDDAIEDVEYDVGRTYATKDSVNSLQDNISKTYVTNENLKQEIEDLVINIENDASGLYATKAALEEIQNDLEDNYSTDEEIASIYATKEEIVPVEIPMLEEDMVVAEISDIYRNLNGYNVTLNLEADYEGDMIFDQFTGGTVIVNLNEHVIKGCVKCSGKHMIYIFNGPGSVQPEGELTDEMVNTFIFEDCEWSLNNVSIYSDLTNANCNAIECDHSTGDLNMVEMMSDSAFSHFIRAKRSNLYLENTSGECSDVLITATDGSIISVNEEGTHCTTTGETVLDIRRGSLLIPDGYSFVPEEPEPEPDPEPEPEEPVEPEPDPEEPEEPETPEE